MLSSPFHCSTQLCLLDFQLRQQINEPLERPLIAIDPEKIDFAQVHHSLWYLTGPFEVAAWTRVPGLPIAVHNRLENRCEWRNTDAGGNQYRMLRAEYMTGWCSIWTLNINLLNTH